MNFPQNLRRKLLLIGADLEGSVTVDGVVHEIGDAVDDDGRGSEQVSVGEEGAVEGEIGGGIVGDENRFGERERERGRRNGFSWMGISEFLVCFWVAS
ncbi:unnamed protein product [Linum trigynum]|uniref:Uncharacterized protein n=1 Tax=Linum trigynum TaxID=586398 RepID=A0AAV2D0Z6_9ROSI